MKARMLAVVAATVWVGLLHPSKAETVTLRFGQIPSTVRGTSSVYLHIAEKNGFLAREQIKLERISIPGGTDKMVVALEQGAVDVTQTATPYLIQAVLRGSDAVGIASETANPIYSLIVKPEIASFADLKGRLLGLSLADRHDLDLDAQAPGAEGAWRRRLPREGAGRHAGAVRMPQARRMRWRAARPARRSDRADAGLSPPWPLDRSGVGVPVPAARGEALVGRGQQGCRRRASCAPSRHPCVSCAIRPIATRSSRRWWR